MDLWIGPPLFLRHLAAGFCHLSDPFHRHCKRPLLHKRVQLEASKLTHTSAHTVLTACLLTSKGCMDVKVTYATTWSIDQRHTPRSDHGLAVPPTASSRPPVRHALSRFCWTAVPPPSPGRPVARSLCRPVAPSSPPVRRESPRRPVAQSTRRPVASLPSRPVASLPSRCSVGAFPAYSPAAAPLQLRASTPAASQPPCHSLSVTTTLRADLQHLPTGIATFPRARFAIAGHELELEVRSSV